MKYIALSLLALAFALAIAPSAFLARAEGDMVMGTHPCPLGLDYISFSVGERVVASVCMSAAELERATYSKGSEKGAIACRVLYLRAK